MVKGHRAKRPGGFGSNGRTIGAASGRRGTASGNGGERVTRSSKAKLTNGLEDPAQVEKDLNLQLRSMGLYAANTMGDGNCLFRALSDQLYGYPHQHPILREQVCDYLATRSERFAAFIDVEKPFEEYVRTMRQSGTYGGHLELSAFAQLQQKEIKIVQPGLVYIVSGEDESPQATKEREKREREREIAQNKTIPGTEGPPPSERELRRLRREKKVKGLAEDVATIPKVGESSKMALQSTKSVAEDAVNVESTETVAAEAYGPLYIAYHNWEHYSSIRNIEGPHTGLPRIREKHASSSFVAKESNALADAEKEDTEPSEEESLLLRSVPSLSLQQVRFYIKQHGGWEEALEAILAQSAVVDDDETEDEDDTLSAIDILSSPDDAARADEAAGPSQPQLGHAILTDDQNEFFGHPPLPDHLRDWRAASPSSVDTIGTHSSIDGGSTSTHATTDDSPESMVHSSQTKKNVLQHDSKRSKRAASKDPMSSLRSPKRRSRSRSPMQPPSLAEEATLAVQGIDALRVRGTPVEGEVERETSKLKVSSTKPLTMRERRQARQEEKARKAVEAQNRRRGQAPAATTGGNEDGREQFSQTSSSHVRGFLELKI